MDGILTLLLHPVTLLPDGDLSDWITEFFESRSRESSGNFTPDGTSASSTTSNPISTAGEQFETALDILECFRDYEDKFAEMLPEIKEAISAEMISKVQNGDLSPLNLIVEMFANRFGISCGFDIIPAPTKIKATQAIAKCAILHKANIQDLIQRAKSGDAESAIKLVKVDPLFLSDSCLKSVIREAAVKNDDSFFNKLADAAKFKFDLKGKKLVRFSLYVIFAFDLKIPAYELQQLIDPDGLLFGGDYGFEKFVTRCRKEFASTNPVK